MTVHTQFSGVIPTARFDAAGAQVSGTFRKHTAARFRVMVRLRFE